MAFPSTTEIYNSMYASTLHKMGRKVVDQTFQKRPLFYKLTKTNRVTESGGRSIQRPVQLREANTAASFGRGATFNDVDPDYLTTAVYYMRNVGDSLTRYWVDEQENTGDSAIINLVTKNIQITVNGLEKQVQAMLWAATPGSIDILSLPHYVATAPTTGSVAGIDRSAETLWRNQTQSASGSFYTTGLDDMMSLKIACEKYGKVNYLICGETFFKLYNAVAREQKYITDKSMGDAEFANVGWHGLPITLDTDCTATSAYFLDTSTLEWHVSPSANMKWTNWKERPNGLDRTAQLILRAQLVCDKLNANGVLSSVTA